MSFLGSLGKVFSTAGTVMSVIPGLGTLPGIAASATGGLLNQMASEQSQKDFYNQQLLYNSPREQLKRIREAGLNPNLIYGSQGVTGMSANDATAPNLEQYRENPFLKMTPQQIQEMAIQRKQQNNQDNLVQSQVDLNNAKADQARKDTEVSEEERIAKNNYNSLFEYVKAEKAAQADLSKLAVDAQRIQNDILENKRDLSEQELTEMLTTWPTRMAKLDQELVNMKKQGKLMDAQTAYQYAQISLIPLQANLLRAQEGKVKADTAKVYKETGLLEQTGQINSAKLERMKLDYANEVVKAVDESYHSNDLNVLGFKFPNPFVRRKGVTIAYTNYLKAQGVQLSY